MLTAFAWIRSHSICTLNSLFGLLSICFIWKLSLSRWKLTVAVPPVYCIACYAPSQGSELSSELSHDQIQQLALFLAAPRWEARIWNQNVFFLQCHHQAEVRHAVDLYSCGQIGASPNVNNDISDAYACFARLDSAKTHHDGGLL